MGICAPSFELPLGERRDGDGSLSMTVKPVRGGIRVFEGLVSTECRNWHALLWPQDGFHALRVRDICVGFIPGIVR